MNFVRKTQDRLHLAEYYELVKSENHLAADLRELLSDEAMIEGLQIDLGGDAQVAGKIIDLLGIDELVGSDKYFNVATGHAGTRGHVSHMSHERVMPLVEARGTIGAAELIQSDFWRVEGQFKRVQSLEDRVTSWLMFVHPDAFNDDTFTLAADATGVVVGVSARYRPELFDEYDEGSSLSDLLEDAQGKRDFRRVLGRLSSLMDYQEGQLEIPSRNYFIRIGQHLQGDGSPAVFGFSPTSVYPNYGHYALQNGRIVDMDQS